MTNAETVKLNPAAPSRILRSIIAVLIMTKRSATSCHAIGVITCFTDQEGLCQCHLR